MDPAMQPVSSAIMRLLLPCTKGWILSLSMGDGCCSSYRTELAPYHCRCCFAASTQPLTPRVAALDVPIALGIHRPMTPAQINRHRTEYASARGEHPRIRVTLATGISPERCVAHQVGYCDLATINPAEWAGREAEGLLLVPKAGELLYRLRSIKAAT